MSKTWLEEAKVKLRNMPKEAKEMRELAITDLCTFAQLVNKGYVSDSHGYIQVDAGLLVIRPRSHLKRKQTHNATSCSLKESHGSYMVCMDDYKASRDNNLVCICYGRAS